VRHSRTAEVLAYFLALFAQRAFIAAEILALAAALILRFVLFMRGAVADLDSPPSSCPSSVSTFSIFSRVAARLLNNSFLVCFFERQRDAIGLAVSHGVNLKAAVRQFGKVNPVILPGLCLPSGLLN